MDKPDARPSPFEEAVALAMAASGGGGLFLAAVSGGADSTAMLAALAGLRERLGFSLRCIHVDHGLRRREESRGDARAVRALCGELGVPFHLTSIPRGRIAEAARERGLGIEGAARLYRHAAWNREARRTGARRILAAHTRDDQAETVLMRILRGSGPGGLSGIPRSRGRLFRPLLDLGRAEVLAYLEERGIPFRTDSTNACNRFLRNRVRNRLIPQLDLLFPHWRAGIQGLAETQALASAFIGAEARRRIPWSREEAAPVLSVPGEGFFGEAQILREEALFQAAGLLRREGLPEDGGLEPDEAPPGGGGLRRGTLRVFARGGLGALDAGPLRLENRGGRVSARPAGKRGGEEGFCLLIKAPGRYKLKGFTVEAGEPRAGKKGFFARLPLVVRQNFCDDFIIFEGREIPKPQALEKGLRGEYAGIMTAADAEGTAAFIGLGRNGPEILLSREKEKNQGETGFFFYLTGG
jgi:tRNA(Ile)-lysidine synthase